MMERHAQLNINNTIVTGIFHEECFPSTDDESYSYYSDETAMAYSNSNNSMPGLNIGELEIISSDKELVTVADEYIESAYHNNFQ